MSKTKASSHYRILFLIVVMFYSLQSWSQECDDNVINEAQKKYDIGLFNDVQRMLQPCMENGFSQKQLIQAYRLMSVSSLAIDSTNLAISFANKLIKIKPDFDAELFGPPKFEQIINEIKQAGSSIQIISVSKRAENLHEAPATVMVISREDIINRGYIDLEQVFSDLPGFDVSRTFGPTYSNIYQRGYRSNNTDRTLFLVDGVEENDLWSNISYWSRQFPVSNVERVEVLYGPASTMYGANALVGVVNVITRDPDQLAGKKNLGVKLNSGWGSYNTKYLDMTIAARKNNVSFSTTIKRFNSSEENLSGYSEFNYDPSNYNAIDYGSFLGVNSNAAGFVKTNHIGSDNPYFTINRDQQGDTVSVGLTEAGANAARNYDKAALSQKLNGNSIGYSNISDHWYFNGKLKMKNLQLGYEFWKTQSGGTNYYNDNNEAGSNNGSRWAPKQSFFYMKYDNNISEKINLMNFSEYRITEVSDNSKAVYLLNYSNGSLGSADLAANVNPFWVTEFYYQISRQFRNEFKITYNPNSLINVVSGMEVRNSSIQGDYRTATYIGNDLVAPNKIPNALLNPSSVIEIGRSSGDAIVGGNDFTIYDLGAYAQGTLKFKEIYKFTVGGRYDYNKIRVTGGFGSQFNPRIALVVTPGKFIFKGVYASAFQNASNWTKFSTNTSRKVNNPNLNPEKVSNLDLSIAYRFTKNIFVDLVYYNSQFNGVVGTGIVKLADGTTTGQNQAIGALKIQGLQSSMTIKLNQYAIYANFTYTDPKNNILKNGVLTNSYQRIGDISAFHFNTGVNAIYFNHLNLNLRMNYVSNRPVGAGTSVSANPGNFPAFVLFNGSMMYKDILPGFNAQLICNNLLDKQYADPGIRSADGGFYSYRTPQRGRNFLIRFIYEF
ncbi:MAG: TonB-dependent receptor [Mariniphaga sp.]